MRNASIAGAHQALLHNHRAGLKRTGLMRIPSPAISTHTSPRAIVVYRQFCLNKGAACEAFWALLPYAALASINDSATRRSIFLLTRARRGASTAICGMAEQELDRAASDTITERAVEALANARLSSQIPEFSGDEPSSTALIRVLMNFVQCALHVLRFGDHVSIEPNPVMHQYMRTMLERTPNSMFYIAFDSTAQSREPWDLSARSNAIDVITYLCVGQE